MMKSAVLHLYVKVERSTGTTSGHTGKVNGTYVLKLYKYGRLVDEYEAFVQWIEIARGGLTGTGNGTLVVVTGMKRKKKERRKDGER